MIASTVGGYSYPYLPSLNPLARNFMLIVFYDFFFQIRFLRTICHTEHIVNRLTMHALNQKHFCNCGVNCNLKKCKNVIVIFRISWLTLK